MQTKWERVRTYHYGGYVIRIYVDSFTRVDFQWRIFTYNGDYISRDELTWNHIAQSRVDAESYIDQYLKQQQ